MFRHVLVLAVLGSVSACATTPQTAERDCITEPEESTGSRVEASKVCAPSD